MARREGPARRGLFISIFMIFFALAAYTIYWFYMANELETGVEEWIEDQRALGYRMEHGGLKMSGYPYRFHLDVTAPDVATPDGDWRWRGETLMLVMQPWNWNRVIGYANGAHQIDTPDRGRIELTATGSQGSFSWDAESITRISLVAASFDAKLADDSAWSGEGAYLHLAPASDAAEDLDVRAGFTRLTLPHAPDDASWLGDVAGPFDAPLRISNGVTALETGGDVKHLIATLKPSLASPLTQFNWGPLKVKLRSKGVSLDDENRPAGALDFRVEEIEGLKAALQQAGELNAETSGVLDVVAAGQTNDEAFLPLQFKDGHVQVIFQKVARLDPVF